MKKESKRGKLATALIVIFLFALVMGPGPGSLLINQHGSEPKFWLGMPALYVWAVFWFFVEAGVILIAAQFIWKKEDKNG
ncbi:MAG: hypothetical protein CMO38_02700 [Verrucomicrobiaceae bacterium]|nr:hypothetical protein [Verrucomicrobiaceae bacterium]|tara:strand:+ start:17791 stop:18030 length:240 start_codon:yes stop_codon:yes gene_type:complete